MRWDRGPALAGLLILGACGTEAEDEGEPQPGPWSAGVRLEADEQAEGDAELGRHLLLHGDYMTCGIPLKLYDDPLLGGAVASGFANVDPNDILPGREGANARLPYSLNAFTSPDGAEVVNSNCLMCHGGRFDGELVLGLGNATADFTNQLGGEEDIPLTDALLDGIGLTEPEKANLRKLFSRGQAVGPEATMRTVGMNPAEVMAVMLMVHHDRDTLAWSEEPLTDIVIKGRDGEPLEDPRVTSDPPPWWRAHKKNALFYNGMARGDHRGTMALATSICVEDVERARVVDESFRHIQAYIGSIRAPAYPRSIDEALAATGLPIYTRDCAGCHGSYGSTDEEDSYPNLLLPLDVIGTDPAVAEAGTVHAPELVEWYNGSFYGGITRMVPDDPFTGYMPPPLDGIWATAPFLHNGSVPTIAGVLDSSQRPDVWRRVDYDSSNFDEEALGWPYEDVDLSTGDLPPEELKHVYDTRHFSQGNGGHTFGDHLTAAERRAVLEYLKTL